MLKQRWKLFASLTVFLCSRLWILLGWGPYITDVHHYVHVATRAIVLGETPYEQFEYGYPPLSLPFIFLPIYFSTDFHAYRLGLQIEMFIADLLCLLVFILFMKQRLDLDENRIALAVLSYALFGLGVGHIIYDRLDTVVALVFVCCLYFYSEKGEVRFPFVLSVVAGTLYKMVPLVWAPISILTASFANTVSETNRAGRRRAKKERVNFPWGQIVRRTLLLVGPIALFLWVYNAGVDGKLFEGLSMQGKRGIQIESTWATPYMVGSALKWIEPVGIASNYEAHHLAEASVPKIVVSLSKVAGFAILGTFYGWLGWYFCRTKQKLGELRLNHRIHFFLMISVLLFFLISQRVLSTTFLIWTIPGLSLWWVLRNSWTAAALLLLLYGLTYIGFSVGYWDFVTMDPRFVLTVSARNVLLVALTEWVVGSTIRLLLTENQKYSKDQMVDYS
ncbi:MAG: hypothetical protein V3T23_01990 [Nitrososphaerales archaeon]